MLKKLIVVAALFAVIGCGSKTETKCPCPEKKDCDKNCEVKKDCGSKKCNNPKCIDKEEVN